MAWREGAEPKGCGQMLAVPCEKRIQILCRMGKEETGPSQRLGKREMEKGGEGDLEGPGLMFTGDILQHDCGMMLSSQVCFLVGMTFCLCI